MAELKAQYRGLIPFKPGQSGNPQGGSKVLREFKGHIRKLSSNGKELIEFLFEQMRDEGCHPAIRNRACEILIRYGFGEPKEIPEQQEAQQKLDLSRFTPEDWALVKVLSEKLKGPERVGDAGIGNQPA